MMIRIIFAIFLSMSGLSYAQSINPNLTISSSAFKNNEHIPAKYTCTGKNVNPPLEIKNVPLYTQSLVLIVHDPDATAADFMHWAVYSINPKTRKVAEDSIPGKELINNFGQFQYSGPCPPNGETHHYVFDLYALNNKFTMNENGSPQGLLSVMSGHILGKAQLVGVYKKP
jgi:Raf kinase inhibitor-like YbhB/YbcL family protein